MRFSWLGFAFCILGCSASDRSGLAPRPGDEGEAGGGGGGLALTGSGGGGGGACVADSLEAELVKEPVDVILYVDTSYSMAPGIAQVEAQLNSSLASILDAGGLDYRLIVLGAYPGQPSYDGPTICIEPPLGGAPCSPPPPLPAATATFFHYPQLLGSGGLPGSILSGYSTADEMGAAPNGYSAWLRPEAFKVVIVISDTASTANDASLAAAADAQLLALSPPQFGTPAERRYVVHSIVGLQANADPAQPYLASDPIVSTTCTGYDGGVGAGEPQQALSVLTGGWRFPMCEFASYGIVFQQIAAGIVSGTALACEIPFPAAPGGQTIDPSTIQIEHSSEGGEQLFTQVASAAACQAGSFYVVDEVIYLCPETCAVVKSGSGSLDIRYGCDVGFVD